MKIAFVVWSGEEFGGIERRYVRLACKLADEYKIVMFSSFAEEYL
jgi:hypothetical protein